MDFPTIQRQAGEWHTSVKGEGTNEVSLLKKLLEETLETFGMRKSLVMGHVEALSEFIYPLDDEEFGEELADVMICLLCLAHNRDLSLNEYVEAKLKKNDYRLWSIGEDGRLHHED